MTMSSSWDGFEIHVDDQGAGEPVVLLHSSGMSGEQWRRTTRELVQRGFRVIVPDLLGSGRSAPWPEGKPFGYPDDVEVVDKLFEKLGEPAHLVGHSYGGLIALHVARRDEARIRSLALYDPVAFGVLEPEKDHDALLDISRVWFGWGDAQADREAWLKAFVDYWGGEGAWSKLRASARAEFLRVGYIAHEGARTLISDTTRADAYASFSFPVLLMTGDQSPPAARSVVERLAQTIPHARFIRFEDAGHMGPLTHVTKLNELILSNLEQGSLKAKPPPGRHP